MNKKFLAVAFVVLFLGCSADGVFDPKKDTPQGPKPGDTPSGGVAWCVIDVAQICYLNSDLDAVSTTCAEIYGTPMADCPQGYTKP